VYPLLREKLPESTIDIQLIQMNVYLRLLMLPARLHAMEKLSARTYVIGHLNNPSVSLPEFTGVLLLYTVYSTSVRADFEFGNSIFLVQNVAPYIFRYKYNLIGFYNLNSRVIL
jgi:hypothetical protein